MHNVVERLVSIQSEIKELLIKDKRNTKPNIIAVCKTFPINNIMPLVEHGHIDFGENKIQEADLKWKDIKNKNSNIKLHMIGKLQTNKVKKALEIFDYIHSVDNFKLAEKIVKYKKELKKKVKCFVQVNIGNENQKNGISPNEVSQFITKCKNDLSLEFIGLMCLPPNNEDPEKHFLNLNKLKEQNNLFHLSIGMTNDYTIAIKCGSTFLRIGSKILGDRKKN